MENIQTDPADTGADESVRDDAYNADVQMENESQEAETTDFDGEASVDTVAAGDAEQRTEEEAATEPELFDENKHVRYGKFRRVFAKLKATENQRDELAKRLGKEQQNPARPTHDTGMPRLEDFESYDEYQVAVVDWRMDQRAQQMQKQELQAQRMQVENTFNDKIAAAYAKDPDFSQNAYIPESLYDQFLESENPVELAYHFGTNVEDARRVASMSPMAAAREIGRIEASLAAKKSGPAQRSKTNAPAPTSPVGRKEVPTRTGANMSTEEWIRSRNKEEFGR